MSGSSSTIRMSRPGFGPTPFLYPGTGPEVSPAGCARSKILHYGKVRPPLADGGPCFPPSPEGLLAFGEWLRFNSPSGPVFAVLRPQYERACERVRELQREPAQKPRRTPDRPRRL